jgi:hypothetical protein
MSNANLTRSLALALVAAFIWMPAAGAQPSSDRISAPVPDQIVGARRIFVSNAGSESYGSESYFRLTRYDGGPDRFYNQFYAAMREWGRYELADSPADADVVYEVRFTSPIVDKVSRDEFVYDPQLHLTLVDPKTRIALWSLTEHIQLARSTAGDNENFDQALARLVNATRMLASGVAPAAEGAQTIAALAPVGAAEVARQHHRWEHAGAGAGLGALAGALIGMRGNDVSCVQFDCARAQASAAMQRQIVTGVGGMIVGGLIGWLWPTP